MNLDIDFACRFCAWTGTDPTFDAHMNTFCPTCGKPAAIADLELAAKKLRGITGER